VRLAGIDAQLPRDSKRVAAGVELARGKERRGLAHVSLVVARIETNRIDGVFNGVRVSTEPLEALRTTQQRRRRDGAVECQCARIQRQSRFELLVDKTFVGLLNQLRATSLRVMQFQNVFLCVSTMRDDSKRPVVVMLTQHGSIPMSVLGVISLLFWVGVVLFVVQERSAWHGATNRHAIAQQGSACACAV
jgi:hypothetical protein